MRGGQERGTGGLRTRPSPSQIHPELCLCDITCDIITDRGGGLATEVERVAVVHGGLTIEVGRVTVAGTEVEELP